MCTLNIATGSNEVVSLRNILQSWLQEKEDVYQHYDVAGKPGKLSS